MENSTHVFRCIKGEPLYTRHKTKTKFYLRLESWKTSLMGIIMPRQAFPWVNQRNWEIRLTQILFCSLLSYRSPSYDIHIRQVICRILLETNISYTFSLHCTQLNSLQQLLVGNHFCFINDLGTRNIGALSCIVMKKIDKKWTQIL
jgi:hypothetical protein